jgi:hypothetical protein
MIYSIILTSHHMVAASGSILPATVSLINGQRQPTPAPYPYWPAYYLPYPGAPHSYALHRYQIPSSAGTGSTYYPYADPMHYWPQHGPPTQAATAAAATAGDRASPLVVEGHLLNSLAARVQSRPVANQSLRQPMRAADAPAPAPETKADSRKLEAAAAATTDNRALPCGSDVLDDRTVTPVSSRSTAGERPSQTPPAARTPIPAPAVVGQLDLGRADAVHDTRARLAHAPPPVPALSSQLGRSASHWGETDTAFLADSSPATTTPATPVRCHRSPRPRPHRRHPCLLAKPPPCHAACLQPELPTPAPSLKLGGDAKSDALAD